MRDANCTTYDADFKQNKTTFSERRKEFFYVPPILVVVMSLFSLLERALKKKTQDSTLKDALLASRKCARIPLCSDLLQ